MSEKKQRVQIDLPEKSMSRLSELKAETEASSYGEVIKNALRLYEAVIGEAKAGNQFLVRDRKGNVREYVIF